MINNGFFRKIITTRNVCSLRKSDSKDESYYTVRAKKGKAVEIAVSHILTCIHLKNTQYLSKADREHYASLIFLIIVLTIVVGCNVMKMQLFGKNKQTYKSSMVYFNYEYQTFEVMIKGLLLKPSCNTF